MFLWIVMTDGVHVLNTPKNPNKDKCLIFYHVAKTAGETLHAWFHDNGLKLWSHYRPTFDIEPFNDTRNLPLSDRDLGTKFLEADVYMGHWAPEVTNTLLSAKNLGRNCYEVTMLRDPLERATSMFFYGTLGNPVTLFKSMLKHPDMFMDHPDFNNDQGNFLMDRRWYFDHICRQFSGLTTTWDEFDIAYGDKLNSTCNVERAKARLLKLDGVGFVEDIMVFVKKLGDMLGLSAKNRKPVQRMNKRKHPRYKQLTLETQQLVRNVNQVDVNLHDWARRTFHKSRRTFHKS